LACQSRPTSAEYLLLIGLDLDVFASVTYRISGIGAAAAYPIKTKGTATFSDSPIAADRIANDRAMHENIKSFFRRCAEELKQHKSRSTVPI
jgi:hypothetical protein